MIRIVEGYTHWRRRVKRFIDEVGRAMQAYQRSTQAFDDEVGRVLD